MKEEIETTEIHLDIDGEIGSIKDKADQIRFDNAFNSALAAALEREQTLTISSFGPFSEPQNDHLLQRLLQSEVRFVFSDFPILDRQMLESLLRARAYSLKKRPKKRDGRSQLPGNPSLQEDRVRLRSARKRKRKALIDQANLQALQRIKEWRAEGLSLSAIAEQLGREGITTTKGKPFYAQTVSRLLDNEATLRKLFRPQRADFLEKNEPLGVVAAPAVATAQGVARPAIPLCNPDQLIFEDVIDFRFAHPLREAVWLMLYQKHEYEEEEILIPAGAEQFRLDVLKETALWPGVNLYVMRGATGSYAPIEGQLLLFASLRPSAEGSTDPGHFPSR